MCTYSSNSIEISQNNFKEQVSKLNEKIKNLEHELHLLKEIQSATSSLLKSTSNQNKSPRYSLEDISFATSLYAAGPRSYRFLRKNKFHLPSTSTLRRWAGKINVEPGLQVQTLAHMSKFDMPLEEKLCVLSFDEMKCREEWAYDRRNDVIIGPKRMIQVAMVRGLKKSWKQLVFYDFDKKKYVKRIDTSYYFRTI